MKSRVYFYKTPSKEPARKPQEKLMFASLKWKSFVQTNMIEPFFFFFLENCTISLCSWPKLQIAHFGIKINLEIHVVGLIYKSLNEIKLC
jgi:hypothetical protein